MSDAKQEIGVLKFERSYKAQDFDQYRVVYEVVQPSGHTEIRPLSGELVRFSDAVHFLRMVRSRYPKARISAERFFA